MESMTKYLAVLISATGYDRFPETIRHNAKMAVIDNIGAAIGACSTDVGRIFLATRSMPTEGCCTIWGGAGRASMMEACFVNASLCQVLDFDDTFEINSLAVSHPGPAVVPAALAAGEVCGCSGSDLIRAVVLGYEVAIRVALAIEPRRDDFWGFANTQVMGAVTAAAAVFGLSAAELTSALGVAAACAPVPNTNMMWRLEDRPMSWIKDGVGFAASTGLMSALMARNGMFACQNSLDEDSGYYLLCGSAAYKGEEITKDFGKSYYLDLLSFKPYPTCRFMQSSLDSMVLLLAETDLRPADIESIKVYLTPYLAKIFAVYEPTSMTDAQFSLPYAAAMILSGLVPSPKWYSKENLADPKIAEISRKVELVPDEGVERKRVEESILSPRVRITTVDGRFYERQEYCAKGHPQKRFKRHDFEQKFRNNASAMIDDERIDQIFDTIGHLERCTDISELILLLK